MTFQTQSAPAAIRFSAVRIVVQKSLKWLHTRSVPEISAPNSAHLLRDAGMPERPSRNYGAEQVQTYRDRHMPLL